MTLRQLLDRADTQLAECHDEQSDRFDFTLSVIRRAHEIALEHHAADAAEIARKVTGPLSPGEGRVILASMRASLPESEPQPAEPQPDTLDPPQVAKELRVSPATVIGWIRSKQLRAANIATGSRPRYIIQRVDLDRFLKLRQV
jgi:DNA-directed RNA polymerase subunit K/omega